MKETQELEYYKESELEVIECSGYFLAKLFSPYLEDIVYWQHSLEREKERLEGYGFIDEDYFDFQIIESYFVRSIKIVYL